jgi:hypothetical protein
VRDSLDFKLIVDGVDIYTQTGEFCFDRESTVKDYAIGASYIKNEQGENPESFFQGNIDELMVFNKPLSNQEIKDMYDSVANIPNNGICGNEEIWPYNDCLELYWSMDMYHPPTAPPDTYLVEDKSGNDYHADFTQAYQIDDGVVGKGFYFPSGTPTIENIGIVGGRGVRGRFNLDPDVDYTWSVWVKREGLIEGGILRQVNIGYPNSLYQIRIGDGVEGGNPNIVQLEYNGIVLKSTQEIGSDWISIVMTKENTIPDEAKLSLYIDGALEKSAAVGTFGIATSMDPLVADASIPECFHLCIFIENLL